MRIRLARIVRALSSRNLRLYFLGQGISLIGTWITNIASSWLVYRLTNSEILLGVVAFSGQFPTAFFGPLAGAIVDRLNRRQVLLATQACSMLQSFLLFALAYSGNITVAQVIALNVFQALVNAFDNPARQSFLSELVTDRRDLPNAIALNAAMFHGSRLVGPAVAGLIIAHFGEASCFLIDGFSYGAVLFGLTLITGHAITKVEHHESWTSAIGDGFKYALASPPIRQILALIVLFSLLGSPHVTLLPVFARDIFGGGPELFGLLMAMSGLGAFTGALFLASRERSANIGATVSPMPALMGASLILLSLSSSSFHAAIALFISGFAMVTLMAGMNSILQLVVEDGKRARVMSLYSSSFFGMMPLGGLLAGTEAHLIGAPITVAIGGVVNLILSVYFAPRLKRMQGTAPEVKS